jgi:hypothetical protein
MPHVNAPTSVIAGKVVQVGDGSTSPDTGHATAPLPVTAVVNVTAGPIEQIVGGVETLVGDGTGGSVPLYVNATFVPPALQNVNLTELAGVALTTFVPTEIVGGTLPAFAAIPTFKIDQTTPGTTNAVDATNFPATVDTNSGNKSASTLRVVLATDQPTMTNAQPVSIVAGSAKIGVVAIDQTTPGTTNAVDVTNLPATVDTNSGNLSASTLRTTLATNSLALPNRGEGLIAAAAPAGAKYTGLLAKTANPAAATDGNTVGAMADKLGRQVVVVGNVRDNMADAQLTLTASTAETTLIAAIASTFNDLYSVVVENTSATATEVAFRDTTGGAVRFYLYIPAGDTRGFMQNSSDGFKQTTVNTNWTAQCTTSVSSIKITAQYVKNV